MEYLDLPRVSAQEVFNYIVNHLRVQGKKAYFTYEDLIKLKMPDIIAMSISESITYGCKYRTVDTDGKVLRCAAGCLISDHLYKPEFEGIDWMGLISKYGFPRDHVKLIVTMQNLHDGASIELWETRFIEISGEYNLQLKSL